MKKTNLLLTLLIVLFTINTNAQIIYTDITDGVPLGIDFNSDGTMEFDLLTGTNPGDYIDYTAHGTDNNIHAIGTLDTSDWDTPDCVDAGFTIDASNQWEGAGDCSVDAWGVGNSTITFNQDEYLCVRFNLGGSDIYYGWIRFSMNNSGIMTYKDYAYNSTPNTPINASDQTLGIYNFTVNKNIKLYPNPTENILLINVKDNLNISKIEILNLLGKKIYISNTNLHTVNTSEFKSGLYYVNIYDNEKRVYTHKMIKL